MKIYTRRGDRGRTSLFGGAEASKDDARVEAYGTVDELNAAIGVARALDAEHGEWLGADEARDNTALAAVQADLFAIGARLAAARPEEAGQRGMIPRLEPARIDELEEWIDRLDEELPPLDAFVLPGGSPSGAQLHVARTVCRRAERRIVHLMAAQPDLDEVIIPYLNRLSDLLFTLARAVNERSGAPEAGWEPMRRRGDR